jgi:archaemetzincin
MGSALALCTALLLTATEERLLVIVPLGAPSEDLVQVVVASAQKTFRMRVEVAEPMALPMGAYYPPRKRWRAERLLDALDRVAPKEAWRVAAITEKPISTTKGEVKDWGIAGLGSLGGKSSVFTSFLFRKHAAADHRRYLKEMEGLVLHEIGHTLGLEHCPLERCLMADAKGNAIRAAEKSINEFCPACWQQIREHLWAEAPRGSWSPAELQALQLRGRRIAADP